MRARIWRCANSTTLCFAAFQAAAAFAQVPLNFVAVPPCRVADTRLPQGSFGGPSIPGFSSRTFPIPASTCNIPANAGAYSINVTVIPLGPSVDYAVVWPTGQTRPVVSTLNVPVSAALANGTIVPPGINGAIDVFVSQSAHVILDINGYFLPTTIAATQSTAVGTGASSVGAQNTAVGFNALTANNTGNANTANGSFALSNNVSGSNNVAVGSAALGFNAVGSANTALGSQALLNNLIGSDNTAVGFNALWENTTGTNNTASGAGSLSGNTGGSYNAALGTNALSSNVSGSSNIAMGYQAGSQITGSYNIDIGNHGQSTDSNTIRIGDPINQTSAYIAGISGVTIANGSEVVVNSNGQLGVVQSSVRYKEDIHGIGSASDALMQLRPVSFRYKRPAEDGSNPVQYGLIGEEVEKIYPELVVYGSGGQVESVKYHELPALLLNEVQKQRRTIEQQESRIAEQEKQIRAFEVRLAELEKALAGH